MPSGPVIRNHLHKMGVPSWKQTWKYFRLMCDTFYGKKRWRLTADGVVVDGQVVMPASDYPSMLTWGLRCEQQLVSAAWAPQNAPAVAVEAQVQSADSQPVVDDQAEEPMFDCGHKGCSYSGYTKKALEAHKKRTGH